MNSEVIFILCFIVMSSMYCKSNFTRLGFIRISLLLLLILIVSFTSQYVNHDLFLSGEQQGHFLEMSTCSNYERLSFIELFKSVVKLFSCHLNNPGLFDFLYKIIFLLASLLLLFISQRLVPIHGKILPNPVIQIIFCTYPLIYGANRSSLSSFSIVCSFYFLINFLPSLNIDKNFFRSFPYLIIALLLPFSFHSIGILFLPLFFSFSFFKSAYSLLRLRLASNLFLIVPIAMFSFFLVYTAFNSESAYILGKSIDFYAGRSFDVVSTGIIPRSTFLIFSCPFFLRLLFYRFRQPNKFVFYIDIVYLVVNVIALSLSVVVSVQVAARVYMLFTPLIYSLYSSLILASSTMSRFNLLLNNFLYYILSTLVLLSLAYYTPFAGQYAGLGLPFTRSILFDGALF